MKVNGRMNQKREKANIIGLMEMYMMVIGKIIEKKEKGSYILGKVIYMKENGIMIKEKGKVFSFGRMEIDMKRFEK